MRIPLRIIAPVVLALLLVAALLLFLWAELNQTDTQVQLPLTRSHAQPESDPTALFMAQDDGSFGALRQGDLAALRGDWKTAQTQYELAVKQGAGLAGLRKLAEAQLQRRDLKDLRFTISRLRDQGAKPEEILLISVLMDLRTGDLVHAKSLLSDAPDSPDKHYAAALIDIIEGNHDAAKPELAAVMAGWDPTLRAYAKELQAAYDEYAKFPESPEIHLVTLLSRALAESQECELALPLLHQVVLKQDDYRDAWTVQGYCQLVTERFEDARTSLEHAYALDPEKPEIQYFLARAVSALGDHQNAITYGQYALTNGFEPEVEVRSFLASEAEATGNTILAVSQYRALVQNPDADFSIYATLASLLLKANQTNEALATAQSAIAKWPDDARAEELLGSVQLQMNLKDDAKASFTKAVQMDPNLTSAQQKLSSIK